MRWIDIGSEELLRLHSIRKEPAPIYAVTKYLGQRLVEAVVLLCRDFTWRPEPDRLVVVQQFPVPNRFLLGLWLLDLLLLWRQKTMKVLLGILSS